MQKERYRSKCCKADVKTEGIPDFLGSNEVVTMNFVCLKCKKACNVERIKKNKTKGKKRV